MEGKIISKNKTIIVTGGSRGIGKAIVLKFAEEKYNSATRSYMKSVSIA